MPPCLPSTRGGKSGYSIWGRVALVFGRYTLACLSLGPSLEGVYIGKGTIEKNILSKKKRDIEEENIYIRDTTISKTLI